MTKARAVGELLFAAVLWGFGFVAAVWALEVFTPIETLVWRFIIASFLGELLYLLAHGPVLKSIRSDFIRAFPAGLFLGGMLLLQTIGLKYTTATKSGFITCLYVIFVPVLSQMIFKIKARKISYFLALLALAGTFLLMGGKIDDFNQGDLWTLGCSVFAAFHILYIGYVSPQIGEAFRFNNFQSLWALLIITPLLATQPQVHLLQFSLKPWIGLISLGLCSSVIAFYLQIRSQKILSDTTASMLFLLESPVAALFGFLLLAERLSLSQTAGAGVILLASALQIFFERAKTIGTNSQ